MLIRADVKPIINEKFDSIPETVETVENLTDNVCQKYKFSDKERDSVAIAVTEAVNNAIFHGNKLDTAKKVHFRVYFDNDTLYFFVQDEGTGFNPGEVPDPLEPDNLLKEHGRGIFILKSLMDQVEYDFSAGGTTIKLAKTKQAKPS